MLHFKHTDDHTTPIVVDVGQLWLLEGTIPPSFNSYIGEEYDGDGLLSQVHDQLLFVNDNEQNEATLLLNERHCKLITMAVSANAQWGSDTKIGKRTILQAIRASRILRDGPPPPVISKDMSPTKERTLEWLKELSPDPTDSE